MKDLNGKDLVLQGLNSQCSLCILFWFLVMDMDEFRRLSGGCIERKELCKLLNDYWRVAY